MISTVLYIALTLTFKTYTVRYSMLRSWDMVTVDEIASTFGFDYNFASRGVVLSDAQGNLLTIDTVTSTAKVRGQSVKLPVMLKRKDMKRLAIPADFWAQFMRILWKKQNRYIYWDVLNHYFFETPYAPSIKQFLITHKSDTLVVKISHERGLLPKIFVSRDTIKIWIKSGFYAGPCWIEGDGKIYEFARIKHSKAGVAFKFRFLRDVGYRMGRFNDTLSVVKFYPESRKRSGSRASNVAGVRRSSTAHTRPIKVIVIDPGHGGKDPGAIGRRGTKEKDIVLAIAKKLKKELEKRGFKVILTRSRDKYLSLNERTEIANNANADLFISIHCNWSRSRVASGTEVYFLSTAKTTWERVVAMRENASFTKYNGNGHKKLDPIDDILLDMAQTEFLQESEDLAGFIQNGIVSKTGLLNRGVRQAGFYVLYGVFMPAVLVETAFLSNPEEERKLRSSDFQWKIARGIADGVVRFKSAYRR